jgi:hypothetical protein
VEHKLYQSDLIIKNHGLFVKECFKCYNLLKERYNISDTTWAYSKYNIFVETSTSILFYKLYKELNYYIRDFIKDDRPLWMKSWLNYHPDNNHLQKSLGNKAGFHFHDSSYHGYISIDPQDTVTKFRNGLEVKNKIGQLYIGPGNQGNQENDSWDHYIDITSPSFNPRITIAFDLIVEHNAITNPNHLPIL